jgi:hypothetical protein
MAARAEPVLVIKARTNAIAHALARGAILKNENNIPTPLLTFKWNSF